MLAKRLTQRGIALSGGALAVLLAQKVASASVPTSAVSSTFKAAGLLAAGTPATAAIPLKVAALTEGVIKAMLLTRLKSVVAVTMAMVLTVGIGAGLFGYGRAAGRQVQGDEPDPVAPRKESANGDAKRQETENVTKNDQDSQERAAPRAGPAAPGKTIVVSNQVSATLTEVRVKRGDRVRQGDVLLRLDNREAKLDLARARAILKAAQAIVKAAETDVTIPGAMLDEIQVRLRGAQVSGARHEVRSPVDGTVLAVFKSLGDRVNKEEGLIALEPTAKPRKPVVPKQEAPGKPKGNAHSDGHRGTNTEGRASGAVG
jgi:biotin carboxyl carrier protein